MRSPLATMVGVGSIMETGEQCKFTFIADLDTNQRQQLYRPHVFRTLEEAIISERSPGESQ